MIQEKLQLENIKNITPILAIETSDKICSVCLLLENQDYFSIKSYKAHSHSEKLFKQIESILRQSEIQLNEIKSLAVSIGPGSFTGLRIGLAAAKGIITGLNIPLIPVPTFEAMAFQISSFLPDGTEFYIANRANKDECFFAKFFVNGNNYIFDSQLKLINQSEVYKLNKKLIYGNLSLNKYKITSPDAEFIAKWAVNFGLDKLTKDIDFLEPDYIKSFIIKENKK